MSRSRRSGSERPTVDSGSETGKITARSIGDFGRTCLFILLFRRDILQIRQSREET
jgi:hypothetical protein